MILLFGATGRVGTAVLQQARQRGVPVRAYVRDASRLREPVDETVTGALHDLRRIDAAMQGVSGVVSAAGPIVESPDQPAIFRAFMTHVTAAMERHDVERISALNGALTALDDDVRTRPRRVWTSLLTRLGRHRVAANHAQLDAMARSGRAWVAARSVMMRDGSPRGWVADPNHIPASTVTRADLAAFLLDQLDADEHLGTAPFVASAR